MGHSKNQLRVLVLIAALLCAWSAASPTRVLSWIEPYLASSHSAESAARAALILLRSCGAGLLVAFCAWRSIWRGTSWLSRLLAGLTPRKFWVLTFLLGVLLRIPIFIAGTPELRTDSLWYHETALSLAQGQGLSIDGQATAYRAPGYPFLLSLLYRVAGPHPELAWAYGLLSIAIIVGASYGLAKMLYDEKVARLTSLLIAIYPPLLFRTGLAMSDLPFVAGLMCLLYLLIRKNTCRVTSASGMGLFLALLVLTRSAAIGLLPLFPVVWTLQRTEGKRAIYCSLTLCMVLATCLAPWVHRNRQELGRASLGSSFGINLYIGNHVEATGGYVSPYMAEQADEIGRLGESEVDRFYRDEAINFITREPGVLLWILPKKLFHFLLLETGGVTGFLAGQDDVSMRTRYGLYGLCQACHLLVLLLFIRRGLDLFSKDRRPRGLQWTGWLMLGYGLSLCLIFFGLDRYRLPILPWMVMEAMAIAGLTRRGKSE